MLGSKVMGAGVPDELRQYLAAKIQPLHITRICIPEKRLRVTDDAGVSALRESISQIGLIQAPGVKPNGPNGFDVIYGVTRVKAWKCLYESAMSLSLPPEQNKELQRWENIPCAIYPAEIPDEYVLLLEIKENLDRKELDAKERAVHTTRLAAVMKTIKANYRKDCNNSDPPKIGRGRPSGVTQEVASEAGVAAGCVRARAETVSELAGVHVDIEKDTPEQLNAAADAAQEVINKEKADKKSRGGWKHGKLYYKSAHSLLSWFDNRIKDGDMTIDDVGTYAREVMRYYESRK